MLTRLRSLRSLIVLATLVVGMVVGVGTDTQPLVAQTAVPKIGTLTVSGWTSQTATISFSLNLPAGETEAEVQVEYGTSRSYGLLYPATYARKSSTGSLTIIDLQPSTNYHFRLKVRPVGGDTATDVSADKTFATRSSDSVSAPSITVQGVLCQGGQCTVTFSTSSEANVQIGWDTSFHAPSLTEFCNPPSGYPNCVSESAGQFISSTRSIRMTNLQNGTLYHYRLMATDRLGNQTMTGNAVSDSEVTTPANAGDRTFSTGGCTVGGRTYPIGSCLPNGNYCSPAGEDDRCTNQCGASCDTGQTCNLGGECLVDPTLTSSAYQCNKSDCYVNGIFQSPARAGCYQSWPKCSANTILKVQKDRACNLWMTCGTSVQTAPAQNQPAENLCLTLAACNQLGPKGQCTHYLPSGQCDNDPLRFCANDTDCQAGGTCLKSSPGNPTQALRDLTFNSPTEIKQVANLSGNVIAGIDWTRINSGSVISGFLPWQLMQQSGGNVALRNADFETNPPDPSPWEVVPLGTDAKNSLQVEYEDQDVSINHVLRVSPVTQVDRGFLCVDDDYDRNPNVDNSCDPESTTNTCAYTRTVSGSPVTTGECRRVVQSVRYFGAATQEFTTQASEYYYASARVRADSGTPTIRFEIGHGGFKRFSVDEPTTGGGAITRNTYVDVRATTAWQTVTIGPIRGLSGGTRVALVCENTEDCSEFFIDDITVKPVLQVNTDPRYVTPSCRLYPKEDSPACDYIDQNGIAYRGWKGYCLENDSVTGSCLSWWPVDIIRGESSIFGADKVTGYQDRAPLYYCAEAQGANYDNTVPYTLFDNYNPLTNHDPSVGQCNPAGNACEDQIRIFGPSATVAQCADGAVGYCAVSATKRDKDVYEDQISMLRWELVAGDPNGETPQQISVPNSPDFRGSDVNRPFYTWSNRGDARAEQFMYYDSSAADADYWRVDCRYTTGSREDLNTNCVWLYLKFDKNTRRLLGYGLQYNDSTGDEYEGAAYIARMYLKEACSKIVQVVTPFGDNQAFAQRVNSRVYRVPDLSYTRSTDAVPFSGLASPEPVSTPSAWPQIFVETRTQEFDEGQTRTGPAYACRGNCSTSICHLKDPFSQSDFGRVGQILSPQAVCLANDSDTNGRNDGFYSGGVTGASNKGPQLFDGAQCVLKTDQTQNCGAGQTCVCKGTDQCVIPFDAQCTTTKPVTGSGRTRAEANTAATRGCYIQTGRCSIQTLRVCSSDSPCPAGAGVCNYTGVQNGTFAIACDGRCGTNTGAGFVKRFTSFTPDVNALSCTQTKFSACIQDGTRGICRRNPSTSCTVSSDCPGFGDFCQTQPVYKCDKDRTRSCTPGSFPSGGGDSECPYQDPVPTNQIDSVCRGSVLNPSPCTCTVSGLCTVDPATNSYQNSGVAEKSCDSSADCTVDPSSGADENRFFAQERLKRLFAQSYGIWEWVDGSYVYQPNSNPSDLDNGINNPDFFGWRPPADLCPIQSSLPVLGCSKLESTQCTASVQITSRQRNSEAAAKDDALGTCRTITACDGNKPECTAKGVAGTAVKYNGFQPTSCTQVAGGQWTCTGRCTVDDTYTNTVPVQSTTPTFKAVRPATPPGDYCSIPPSYSNAVFTTGNATLAVIDGGSGSVGIKFNTAADPEQVPLQTISIDWGDGTPDTISYPYAPRSDVRKPHIFSHVYSYNKADSVHCPASDGPCTYPIKIQVRDNWGWCNESMQKFCSNTSATTAPAGNQRPVGCNVDADCRSQGSFQFCRATRTELGSGQTPAKCNTNTDYWVDSGLKVILNP